MQLDRRRPIAMKRLLSRMTRAGSLQQHAHLGEAARQHEVFDDLEKGVWSYRSGSRSGV